jgi:Phage tail tube protein
MSVTTPGVDPTSLTPGVGGYTGVPTPYSGVTNQIEEREVNSEWGQLWVNGFYQQDLVAFTGTAAIGRTEVAVAGSDTTVYRTTRQTRDGTISYRKSDSRWEYLILTYMGLSANDKRALRAQGIDPFPQIQLLVVLDDPDSWGAEILQLNGVRMWSMPLGYTGADIIQRDIPVTWDSEQLLLAIPRPGNLQGSIGTEQAHAALGFDSGTSYGAFGGPPVF